jgi:putative transcriptional regulator
MSDSMQAPEFRRHPTEANLLAYAAGTLPEALGLVLATHLTGCATCQATVALAEAVGGALLDSLPPAEMAADAAVADALLAGAPASPFSALPVLQPDLPPPLNRVAFGRWWTLTRGLRWRPMRAAGSAWGGLLLVQPGHGLPRHGHKGRELTCALAGAFVDGNDIYRVGDVADPVSDHDPLMVVGAEPCLCVIASEGFRLRGIAGFLQRIAGW